MVATPFFVPYVIVSYNVSPPDRFFPATRYTPRRPAASDLRHTSPGRPDRYHSFAASPIRPVAKLPERVYGPLRRHAIEVAAPA
jgi:hypothetical protein